MNNNSHLRKSFKKKENMTKTLLFYCFILKIKIFIKFNEAIVLV